MRHGFVRACTVLIVLSVGVVALTACGDSHDGESEEPPEQQQTISASDYDEPVEPPEVIDDERSVSDRLADMRIAARVKQELTAEGSLRTFDFEPEVVDGELVLWGDVLTRNQYDRAETIARDVDGVREVHNALTIEGQAIRAESGDSDDDDAVPSAPSSAEFHTIQSGESLWIIARSYNTSVERIQQLNDISGTNVQPGDRIRVR